MKAPLTMNRNLLLARVRATTLTLTAAAALAACAVPGSSPYTAPPLELPSAAADLPPLPAEWWKQFDAPQLDVLVQEALSHNRDLQRAMARIDESRAALRLAHAGQVPTVSASAGAARSRSSQTVSTPVPPGTPPISDDRRLSLDVAYELDLWGRAASISTAAREELLATRYARETLRTALIAQVIHSYATLQSLDAQHQLYGQAVDAQRESLRLQRLRLEAGDIGELDIRQLEADLLGNESQLPRLDRARGEAERALAVLLGRSPRAVLEQPIQRTDKPLLVQGSLPAGLPSDLLLRRPDVQAAEARLRAAGAQVDAARAAYFPTIALTASYGRESADLSRLMDAPSLIWSVVASITQPIWNGGRLQAQDALVRAQQLQSELDYRDSVANAFRETRDALAALEEAQLTQLSNTQRSKALERAAQLTRLRYEGGEASRLDLIEAERAALAAEAMNADARRALASAQANVFRALGGGWYLRSESKVK
jgi:outer membrane protein, multidrug efflux system